MDSIEQKANELVDKFRPYSNAVYLPNDKFVYKPEIETKNAKKCALICVEEIMKSCAKFYYHKAENYRNTDHYKYHQQVKERLLAKPK